MNKDFKYIYGPVFSVSLGYSLGVDAISTLRKNCSFDCIYCQIGKTHRITVKRRVFVKTSDIIKEIRSLSGIKIDYITFSGMGEPTLAKNLGELIRAIKKIRKENIAVLTNLSLIHKKSVRDDLKYADFIIAKLDVASQHALNRINRPRTDAKFKNIIEGLTKLKKGFKGKLALRIMLMDENKDQLALLIPIINNIRPDEVQLNTPLRPCSVKKLSKNYLKGAKKYFLEKSDFKGSVKTAYDVIPQKPIPVSLKSTLRRRPKK